MIGRDASRDALSLSLDVSIWLVHISHCTGINNGVMLSEPDLRFQTVMQQQIHNRLLVRRWLYCVCLLVFAMVVVGGITRLTDSGLSITEWKPILGFIPPLNDWDWLEAFDKYQQIPEYRQINHDMSLNEFKFIYWWEWGHRFLGRFIGLFVIIPLVWFWATGKLERKIKPRLVFLFLLGGLQGVIGWWMVKSGLTNRVDVSQYRLAVHLTLAAVIFAWGLWIARGLAPHSEPAASPVLQKFALMVTVAMLIQLFLGALVAGLDAGLSYNDWPLMDGAVIPQGLGTLEPVWLNLFENPKAVQFVHRLGGYSILLLVIMQMILTIGSNTDSTHVRRSIVMVFLVLMQVGLGIVTLVLQVPFGWALVHQAAAIVVLGFAVAHWRALRGPYPNETGLIGATEH